MKFASEDIKAWYMEAATARPGKATSGELMDWFWAETVAGKMFIDVYNAGSSTDDEKIKRFVNEYTVPRSQKHRLGG